MEMTDKGIYGSGIRPLTFNELRDWKRRVKQAEEHAQTRQRGHHMEQKA